MEMFLMKEFNNFGDKIFKIVRPHVAGFVIMKNKTRHQVIFVEICNIYPKPLSTCPSWCSFLLGPDRL